MSGERQGWSTWDRYQQAGIVGTDVMFTDNKITTDHALGKTSDTIGKCWPMDAAVAYTLASAGPDANLKATDMVNQHTKMAAAMMTQMVGYGTVPDPRVDSCGHDEVDAMEMKWMKPILKEGRICWSKQEKMGQIAGSGTTSWSFRVPRREAEEYNTAKAALGILMSAKFAPLRLAIEKDLKTTKWALVGLPFSVSHTLGTCKWAGKVYPAGHEFAGKTMQCAHHTRPKYTGWVLIKQAAAGGKIKDNRFVKMWSREKGHASVHQGWNNDMIAQTLGMNTKNTIASKRIVLWDKVARSLSNTIWESDPKFVLKEIKATLRRMQGRNLNCVKRDGEYRENGRIRPSTVTFAWKNWAWLANLEAWIAQTSKKNRKEHDLVNGWKWTKYDSKKSYGHEIAKFKWVPGMVNEDYDESIHTTGEGNALTHTTPPALPMVIGTYYLNIGGNSWKSQALPYSFKTKQEAYKFKGFLSMMASKCGAVNKDGRKWDGEAGMEQVDGDEQFSVMRKKHVLEMPDNIEPEVTPSPQEIMEALLFGTPQEFDEHISYLSESCRSQYKRPKVKAVEEKKEVVA